MIDMIKSRRSIRSYTEEKVKEEEKAEHPKVSVF